MNKHIKDHPRIRTFYGFVGGYRETRTRLEPSAAIHKDDGPSVTDLEEPQPSGGRRIIPDGQKLEDIESFEPSEDPDAVRWKDEHD